jgi:phage I-like protein
MEFSVLLDAPRQARERIQIAKIGDNFKDKRYGTFAITRDEVEAWKRNLDLLPGKRALIDLDHSADRSPRKTEAAGWITNIEFDGDVPVADVEWTSVGKQAIEDGRYLFFSPTYGTHKTEDGVEHENTLIGGALTNRPFLDMPMLTLASDETLRRALAEDEQRRLLEETLADRANGSANETRATADSRRTMDKEVLKALGLPDDTDVAGVLDAITNLSQRASDAEAQVTTLEAAKPEQKTLQQLADEEGKVVLDSVEVADMRRKADLGEQAHKQLEQQRFTTTFDKAVREGRAVPAQLEQFTELHAEKPELALKMLDSGPQIVNTRPSNWDNKNLELEDAPAGVDAESRKIDVKVKQRLRELNKPMSEYPQVLEQMMQEGEL